MLQAKGSKSYLAIQQEVTFGVTPTAAATTKLYFESETLSQSLPLNESNIITGSRDAIAPTRGDVDVSGGFASELMAGLATPIYGVMGSVATTANSGTGETVGSALTTPTAVIDSANQTLTVTATSHGIALGDTVQIAGLTAPTSLNNLYCRCIGVTSANIFVLRIPVNTSTTFTLGTGTLKKVTAEATTYKHTLKVGSSIPSFLIEKGFSDIGQYFKYQGCKFGKLSMDITPSGAQKINFDIMGASETSGSSAYAAPTDPGQAKFDGLAIGTIEEAGAAIATVSSISGLTIDNQLDGDTYLIGGGGQRGGINEGLVKVSGSLKTLFQDRTLYNKALNSTESSLRIVYNRGTGAGTSGNESFEIKIPELIFGVKTPAVDKPGGLWVELEFTGYYTDSAEATSAQIILKVPTIKL